MDCDKFESVLMDELYDELDEVASIEAKRHVEACSRCATLFAGLRATRRVASVPALEAPPDLEDRVLAAARETDGTAPRRGRVAMVLSLAGAWAMRPQTAMGALFLVMIGTSVLLLRAKAARAPQSGAITVTERGAPAPPEAGNPTGPRDPAPLPYGEVTRSLPASAASPIRTPAAKGAAGPPSEGVRGAYSAAMRLYESQRFDEAARAFDALSAENAGASLWAARSVRQGQGCGASLPRFERAAQEGAGTPPGWDALLEGARCRSLTGDVAGARARLDALLRVPAYESRARADLDRLDDATRSTSPAAAAANPATSPLQPEPNGVGH